MFEPLQQFLDRLRHPEQQEAARAELYGLIYRLRADRKELLTRIGEEVAVWHQAGETSERLLTEELSNDLERLADLEAQLAACRPLLEADPASRGTDPYLPTPTMLADADSQPEVIRRAPTPPGTPAPDPAPS